MDRDDDRPPVYEAFCIMCGRGLGRDGTLFTVTEPPKTLCNCRFCGGVMMVRHAEDTSFERWMRHSGDLMGRAA